jgi:hypothetical protein
VEWRARCLYDIRDDSAIAGPWARATVDFLSSRFRLLAASLAVSGSYVLLSVVPEPSTLALLGASVPSALPPTLGVSGGVGKTKGTSTADGAYMTLYEICN